MTNETFNAVWDALANVGKCDSRPGCEYGRVCSEYLEHGLGDYESLAAFIVARANTRPFYDENNKRYEAPYMLISENPVDYERLRLALAEATGKLANKVAALESIVASGDPSAQ